MAKLKRKLTAAEKRARASGRKSTRRCLSTESKRILREPTIDGLPVDEFIALNADPIWLHQNGMWEYLHVDDED